MTASSGPSLRFTDMVELDQMAAMATSSDEKTDFLFEVNKREIHHLAQRYKPLEWGGKRGIQNIIGFILHFGIGIASAYLAIVCYPSKAFVWGDYGERYAELKQRRGTIPGIILVGIFIALAINVYSTDLLDRFFPAKP